MSNEKMTEKRAGEIALLVVRYESTRKTININPNDDQPEWVRIERQIGFKAEKIKQFILQIILPAGLSGHFGMNVKISADEPITLNESELHEISLAILRYKGIDLNPDTLRRLKRMEEFTKIPMSQLREFYLQFIIPDVISKIMNWDGCKIEEVQKETSEVD